MSAMQRAMSPLLRRLQLMVGRAVVLLVKDGLKLQGLQVSLLADEVRDDVEHFQAYGLTSHPLPGAEALVVCVGGSRDHAVVIAVDDRRYRLKPLQAGEVALYTDQGDTIVLKRDGHVHVTASTKVTLQAPLVECTGNVTVAGTLTAAVDVVADGVSLVGHAHGGVDPGVGTSGPPV